MAWRGLVRVLAHAAPVAGLTAGVAFGACTFPDVDYADGGSCPGLSPCTDAASSCAASAESTFTACTTQCHGGPGCVDKCNTDHAAALSACAATCTTCAPGCSVAPAACKTAAGM